MKHDPYYPSMSIRLISDELDKKQVRDWYQTVKMFSPSGVITSMQVPGKDGELENALMVKTQEKEGMCYAIPSVRYLSDDELEPIAKEWDRLYPEKDFEIASFPGEQEIRNFR